MESNRFLKQIFTSTDNRLSERDKELQGKDKELQGKDKELQGKNDQLQDKNKLLFDANEKLADANSRHLKEIGDFSLRRVIENVESVKLFRNLKNELKEQTIKDEKARLVYVKGKSYSPYRRSVWAKLLDHPESAIRFQHLKKLSEISPDIDVPEIISRIHSSSSKGIHSYEVKMVFINTSSYSPSEVFFNYTKYSKHKIFRKFILCYLSQVIVAEAICKDWPVLYFVGTEEEYFRSQEGGVDDEITMI